MVTMSLLFIPLSWEHYAINNGWSDGWSRVWVGTSNFLQGYGVALIAVSFLRRKDQK